MNPRRRLKLEHVLTAGILLVACLLGVMSRKDEPGLPMVRAQWHDAGPLGGKGLRLLLKRLGHTAKLVNLRLDSMPADSSVWLLLDPQTRFSRSEAQRLLAWVASGNTLILAANRSFEFGAAGSAPDAPALVWNRLGITNPPRAARMWNPLEDPLPPVVPLNPGVPSVYWAGVNQAYATTGELSLSRPFVELATASSTQVALLPYGRGRVIVTHDASLFANFALSRPDTAVLATNLITMHAGNGVVHFDERRHGERVLDRLRPTLLYYLWRPPLRYAILQLLAAGLLLWALYGRRLGAPLVLPEREPVTTASSFARAMGTLFHKAGRAEAAAIVLQEQFRRKLSASLGVASGDDEAVAARAAAATGLPQEMIRRLLDAAEARDDATLLALSQDMQMVMNRLKELHAA